MRAFAPNASFSFLLSSRAFAAGDDKDDLFFYF
jgi:hypothetical protein